MRRAWVWFVLLCLVSTVANAQYASKRAFRVVRADGSEVNGDSGAVVAVYPCSLGAVVPDTSGRRVDAVWFSTPRRWEVTVDETRAYSFYYRASCCLDTLAVPLECIPLVGPDFVAGAIESADLATGSALQNLIDTGGSAAASLRGSSIGSDSLTVEADTIDANYIHASSELLVQGGVPPLPSTAILHVDDAAFTLRSVEATLEEDLILDKDVWVLGKVHVDSLASRGGYIFGDSLYVVEYLRADGPAWLRGDNTMGTGISNTLTVNGTVAASNDITATDAISNNGNATLGNADGDLTTVRDLEVANEANFSSTVTTVLGVTVGNDAADLLNVVGDATVADVTTLNGAMNLGNATSDALTGTGDFTWEGDFDVEDSLAVGDDFGAADSTKSAARLGGFLELPAASFRTATLTAGVASLTVKWPGLRANDHIEWYIDYTTTATAALSMLPLFQAKTGEVVVSRTASASTLVVKMMAVKG